MAHFVPLWDCTLSKPESNFFRMPNEWIDLTASIDNIAELKVIQYILRHTWGYQEYNLQKHITIDEFINGRKRKDRTRMDTGTGLSEMSVRNGLTKAIEHGFIEVKVDDSDKARVKKYYSLKMRISNTYEPDEYEEVQSLESGVQSLDPRGTNFIPRSEKETIERNFNIRNSNSKLLGNVSNSNAGYKSFKTIGDLLKKKTDKTKVNIQEIPEEIKASIDEISKDFGEKNLRSNLTHVMRIYQESGKSMQRFTSYLYEAKSITKQQGSVKKMMPYFFSVLENIVGLKESPMMTLLRFVFLKCRDENMTPKGGAPLW